MLYVVWSLNLIVGGDGRFGSYKWDQEKTDAIQEKWVLMTS